MPLDTNNTVLYYRDYRKGLFLNFDQRPLKAENKAVGSKWCSHVRFWAIHAELGKTEMYDQF